MLKRLFFGATIVCLTLLAAVGVHAQEIPVEVMFKKADFGATQLSPNTKMLAALVPYKGRFNLAVIDMEKNSLSRVTAVTDTDVGGFFWQGNDRIVFSTADRQGFDSRGDGGLYAVNIDGSGARELSKPIRARAADGTFAIRIVSPIGRVKGSPDEIYVSSNERSSDSQDIFKVNTRTGRKSVVTFDSPGNVQRWVLDHNFIPRAAVTSDRSKQKAAFYYRASEGAPWEKMYEWDLLEDEISPQAFDSKGKLYVSSNVGRNTIALFEYDLAAKKLGKLVYGDDTYDLTSPTIWGGGSVGIRFANEDDTDTITGISYTTEKPVTVWFDDKYARVQAELDRTIPNAINNFGVIKDQMLVRSSSDRDPGTLYLYDRIKPSLTEVLRFQPGIKPANMVEMKPIKFTARDGTTIHGYLTLPKTYATGKPVPLIVHPHGGPWARDVWGYRTEVQFMANRGFAVLQVNFRNSTGYGSKILRGGYKQWGERTQDDIEDALQWTIKEGYADKNRIGVYGASFGGYSTLMQLVRSPDLYKWGINYVGVTDMFVHQETQPAQRFGDFYNLAQRTNGDKKTDREMFERTSPTLQIAKLRAPVLHAYGGEDRNVDIANGHAIKSAFEKSGKPLDYIFVAEEAHGYREDNNVFMFYGRFDEFIKKNTPK